MGRAGLLRQNPQNGSDSLLCGGNGPIIGTQVTQAMSRLIRCQKGGLPVVDGVYGPFSFSYSAPKKEYGPKSVVHAPPAAGTPYRIAPRGLSSCVSQEGHEKGITRVRPLSKKF